MITLPEKFLTRCAFACGGIFSLYVVFMIVTICFASYQGQLSKQARDKEAAVVALETKYYAAIDSLSASDPSSLGLVRPTQVQYVAAQGGPTVTRADR